MSKTTYYIGHREHIREWVEMHGLGYALGDHQWLDLASGRSIQLNRAWVEDVVRQVKDGTAELVVSLGPEEGSVFEQEWLWIESLGLEYDRWNSHFRAKGTTREPAWIA